MMSKKAFIELVIESMAGGAAPDNRKYHPVVIAQYVNVAINSFIGKSVKEDLANGTFTVDNAWIKSFYKVRIKYDQIRGQCFIKLPAKPILLENNRGIREVGWNTQDGSPTFVINDASSYSVLSNLECSILPDGVYMALVEGDYIYFPDMPKALYDNKKTVMVKMVCGAAGYTDEEELPIPEDSSLEIFTAIQNIMNVTRQTPIKVNNNSNPNTP